MLPDRERAVLQCRLMRLNEREALAYLQGSGFQMSPKTYWRIRSKLEKTKQQRLFEIGQAGFVDQHLWRIDTLETVEQELWRQYVLEKSPFKKARILVMIAEVQPYLGTFYRTTKKVIENQTPQQGASSLPRLAR